MHIFAIERVFEEEMVWLLCSIRAAGVIRIGKMIIWACDTAPAASAQDPVLIGQPIQCVTDLLLHMI